eukprot:Hpha_TRINITY_DN16701_c0_g1::TRINITY_DN16701_c0_g1_i3::g.76900::m.76900
MHGLSPGVGMGGIYTGGGWHLFMTPHYGWAVDNIVSFTLVTPGGSIVKVGNNGTTIVSKSPYDTDLETKVAGNWLNWAARGSWSAFGIITEFEIRTHPYPEPDMLFRVIEPWTQEEQLQELIANPPAAWSCGSFGLGVWGFKDVHAVGCTKLDKSANSTIRDVMHQYGVKTI